MFCNEISCAMLLMVCVSSAADTAQWISGDSLSPDCPAPVLERSFVLKEVPSSVTFNAAVAGWCEICVNGIKAGDEVLFPTTCQPDKRISSVEFDVRDLIRIGTNTISILLGNGWYNAFTKTCWKLHEAPWIGCPMVRGGLRADGCDVLVTDANWVAYDSPIVFNALRNGEWYDARLEGTRRRERPVKVEKYSPWGGVRPDDSAPCKAFESFRPVSVLLSSDGARIYDFGVNISGWCEIDVKGVEGSKITLDYDESITPTNTLLGQVNIYQRKAGDPRPAQHDEYVLAGRSSGESWHPRFTYHGFRYVKVSCIGQVSVEAIRARFVHSALPQVGELTVSDPTFAGLQASTMRSYLSNFVGIPTDCPHREKNGWTGDAQIAMETGLWNFDARDGYVHFMRMMLDGQLPNGAVPCILPYTQKFGYFWGSGPAWDALLFEIPWQLFWFYGDEGPAREAYEAMKRYLAFIETKEDEGGLYCYGLGDWCHPNQDRMVTVRLTDSAYVYQFNRRLAFWARRFGDPEYASKRSEKAEQIAKSFNRKFHAGDGLYAKGELTALAAPLYFEGLCEKGLERRVAKRLVEAVREKSHVADFGILGAKWVPRVLAKYGYIDDAWRLFTQKEMPGWAHWLQFGDGTLRERWDDTYSHNHIMFGDLSAWAYEWVAGISPVEPGFKKITLRPQLPDGVLSFSAKHQTPYGEILVRLTRERGRVKVNSRTSGDVEVVEQGAQDANKEKKK